MFHYPMPTDLSTHMAAAPYIFYLTGSKFFGGVTKTSDTDYFVQNSPLLDEFLSKNGFGQVKMSRAYTDYLLVDLWVNRDENVHVQVVSDAKHKLRAQELLKHDEWSRLYKFLPKLMRRDLWNIAIMYTRENG